MCPHRQSRITVLPVLLRQGHSELDTSAVVLAIRTTERNLSQMKRILQWCRFNYLSHILLNAKTFAILLYHAKNNIR